MYDVLSQVHNNGIRGIFMKLFYFLLMFINVSFASNCPDFYYKSEPKTKIELEELCFSEFVVAYDKNILLSRYSYEKLTKEAVITAKGGKRLNSFHANKSLSKQYRAELEDYRNSGFDKGHLAPFGNMTTKQGEYDSFDLTNIIPQNHINNIGMWKQLEEKVREYAVKQGTIYVATGPIIDTKADRINNRVLIPTHIFKAIYDPLTKMATVYVMENNSSGNYIVMSLNDLKKLIGIDIFPKLTAIQKNSSLKLFEFKR